MASIASKQAAAGLDCFQKMKSADRASGAERFIPLARDHYCRTVVALDNSRSGNANDAAMPSVAVDDDAVGVTQRGLGSEALFDRAQDSAFFFLPIGVELIELGRKFPRPGRIFHAEQFDDIASDVHAACGIDARSNAESDFTGCGRTVWRDLCGLKQGFQSRIDRSAQGIQTERSKDAILSRQREASAMVA